MSTCPDASSSADNATVRDRTAEARKELLLHLGIHRFPGHRPSERTTDADILFWVELSPNSKAGDKKCTLNCGRRIFPGDYRIALNPGQKGVALENGLGWWYGPDYYHVECFEKIADFAEADFLDRITPVTPYSIADDPMEATSCYNMAGAWLEIARRLTRHNPLDAGAERLIFEWKKILGNLSKKRDGIQITLEDPDMERLLYHAGSAAYEEVMPIGMDRSIFLRLKTSLAPIERRGATDPTHTREWNLFEMFLSVSDNDMEHLTCPNTLSCMLQKWWAAKKAVKGGHLDEELSRIKNELGSLGARAVDRLSDVYPIKPRSKYMHFDERRW